MQIYKNFVDLQSYIKRLFIPAVFLLGLTLPVQASQEEPDSAIMLDEVIVTKKARYTKKNNPAVALMERIRASRHLTDPLRKPYYSYDKYDKTVLAINDFDPSQEKGFVAKHMKFIFDFVDTSELSGRPILPVSLKETSSRRLYRASPRSDKELVNGMRRQALMESLNQDGITRFVEDVLREVDIYDNDITLMQNRFVSPLSHIAGNYYKFFLDTVITASGKMLELSFAPHNPESMGFNGRMYIPEGDSTMFISKISMQVPRAINLNYVKSLYLVQEFERDPDGTRHKVSDDMTVEIEIVPGTPGVYARRITMYDNFSDSEPDASEAAYLDKGGKVFVREDAAMQTDDFWASVRKVPVKEKEQGVKRLLAMLREHRWFYWTEKVVGVLVTGYIPTGKDSKVDLGPVNTLISVNNLEGARFRVGGMTTASLSRHLFARGYLAYGCKDRKFKYGGELEYSFIPKKVHSREFPVHSLKLSHSYDVDQIGQHYLFTNPDNIFLSLKRKENDKMTYRRLTRLDYTLERAGGFSLQLGVKHEIQEPTRYLNFEDAYGHIFDNYTQAAFAIKLRYAPGESFYQTRSSRVPINMDAPVFTLSHEYGPKGMLGSDFCTNKTEFSVQKRFWFSSFGYADVLVKAARIWSRVQYPALAWVNSNLSYTIQPESFALMNPMEFATDSYVNWDLTYWGNGILFNRIPIIKYLRLREVLTFKGVYGHLCSRNNPEFHNELFRFPFDTFTRPIGDTPYMEAGIGIDNIFTILRIDYVWRLTYRDIPNVDKSGVRVSLHFAF